MLVYEGLQPRFAASTRLRAFLRQPRRAVREWLSSRTVLQLIETDLDRALTQLYHKATTFEVQLADTTRPTRLEKAEAFRFLRRLVNYNGREDDGTALKYDSHVDYFMADSAVECHRSHLDVDGVRLKVLTMKEPPNATFAHLLEDADRLGVVGAVVDDNHFEARPRLGGEGIERLRQVFREVEIGHHHTDKRLRSDCGLRVADSGFAIRYPLVLFDEVTVPGGGVDQGAGSLSPRLTLPGGTTALKPE